MNNLTYTRQQGAALIVSLLILLIMSILAVTSLTTTSTEEKMTSNTRQERIAFEAAEVALRTAEDWLLANITDRVQIRAQVTGNPFLYSEIASPVASRTPVAWDVFDPATWAANNSAEVGTTTVPMLSDPAYNNRPRFVIEYIGRIGDPPLNYRDPDLRPFAFRITAVGWGLDTTAYYLLRSTFRMPL